MVGCGDPIQHEHAHVTESQRSAVIGRSHSVASGCSDVLVRGDQIEHVHVHVTPVCQRD